LVEAVSSIWWTGCFRSIAGPDLNIQPILFPVGPRNKEIDMLEPKQHTLEDDELFLVSFIMLALGNGILIAIVLMVWRNQALDVDDELVRWVLAAVAMRIFSLQLLRRCTDKLDLAVADTAMAFAAMLLSLIHGFVAGAVTTGGMGLLHGYRALQHSLDTSCRT
jgi:hypothetical protein